VLRAHPAIRESAEALPDALAPGAEGKGVIMLQHFLMGAQVGPAARVLAAAGATGYFGPATHAALAEYQRAVGIAPASGHFGQLTRTRMASALYYEPVRDFERALGLAASAGARRAAAGTDPLAASETPLREAVP
jgi:peptidoglycan hydrolase-like protein with peptidoglycan-binding domain